MIKIARDREKEKVMKVRKTGRKKQKGREGTQSSEAVAKRFENV